MQTVTMEEAQAQLPELLEAAAKGEPFQVEQASHPIFTVYVQLQSAADLELAARQDRRLGTLEGRFSIPDDFNTMFAEEIRSMFEDGEL